MSEATAEIREDTVEALVTQVRELLHTEDSRERDYGARAGILAGVCGVVASLAGAAGAALLTSNLVAGWRWSVLCIFAGFSVANLGALAFAIFGVLIPRDTFGFSVDEVAMYPTWAYVTRNCAEVQGRILHGLVEILAQDRRSNTHKAAHLRRAYQFLALATTLFSTLVVILGMHTERVI